MWVQGAFANLCPSDLRSGSSAARPSTMGCWQPEQLLGKGVGVCRGLLGHLKHPSSPSLSILEPLPMVSDSLVPPFWHVTFLGPGGLRLRPCMSLFLT